MWEHCSPQQLADVRIMSLSKILSVQPLAFWMFVTWLSLMSMVRMINNPLPLVNLWSPEVV